MTPLDIDLWLLLLRLAFVGLLYLFLLQVVLALRRDLRQAAAGPAPMAHTLGQLAVVESDQPDLIAGKLIPLQPTTTIGRSPHNTITLNDSFVSASHAVISWRGKHWLVEDMGSTNGTFVNRRQVREPTAVEFGDLVEVGRVKFKLVH